MVDGPYEHDGREEEEEKKDKQKTQREDYKDPNRSLK
jgi:hypothetical protein